MAMSYGSRSHTLLTKVSVKRNPASPRKNGSTSGGRRRGQEPKTPIERFIGILNNLLVSNRMSQRELAERLGVTIGTLTKYLRGEVFPDNIKTHINEKLAKLRGVSLDELLKYYQTGEFDSTRAKTSFEDVVAWVGSDAGQEDLLKLVQQATEAQMRILKETVEHASSLQEAARWGDEGALIYGQALHETFLRICEQKGLSDWDGWGEFKNMPAMRDKSDAYLSLAQQVFSGQAVLTGDMMTSIMNEFGDCPGRIALEEWSGEDLLEIKKLGNDAIENTPLE